MCGIRFTGRKGGGGCWYDLTAKGWSNEKLIWSLLTFQILLQLCRLLRLVAPCLYYHGRWISNTLLGPITSSNAAGKYLITLYFLSWLRRHMGQDSWWQMRQTSPTGTSSSQLQQVRLCRKLGDFFAQSCFGVSPALLYPVNDCVPAE